MPHLTPIKVKIPECGPVVYNVLVLNSKLDSENVLLTLLTLYGFPPYSSVYYISSVQTTTSCVLCYLRCSFGYEIQESCT